MKRLVFVALVLVGLFLQVRTQTVEGWSLHKDFPADAKALFSISLSPRASSIPIRTTETGSVYSTQSLLMIARKRSYPINAVYVYTLPEPRHIEGLRIDVLSEQLPNVSGANTVGIVFGVTQDDGSEYVTQGTMNWNAVYQRLEIPFYPQQTVTGKTVRIGMSLVTESSTATYVYLDNLFSKQSPSDEWQELHPMGAGTVTGVEEGPGLPTVFKLYQNHPNPFNPATTITFDLPKDTFVSLGVYNLLGEEVARVVKGFLPAGKHRVLWDAANFPSGIYFARLTDGRLSATKRMILLR